MTVRNGIAAIALVVLAAGCGSRESEAPPAARDQQSGSSAATASALPDRITITEGAGLTPEGVEYDTKGERFLVGSISRGTVFVVGTDGSLTPFAEDAELRSTVGIEVDEERNRLLVANSDASAFGGQSAGQAKLGIFDLGSGSRIAMIDLAAAGPKDAKSHFANDLTVGSDGSVYVTDTMARVVYRVDSDNNVSVFLPPDFAGDQQPALNGIVFHPSGFLLIADMRGGQIYKVPVDDPKKATAVKLSEPVTGADGLVLHPNGNLIVVRNDDSRSIVALSSTDDWETATVAARGTASGQATTAAIVGEDVYVVYPFFGDQQAQPYIERIPLQ
ncbi:MAG: SMP-30/gluconolactonase/LRE family protein [Pseudomonadota bacterium]|jgi:Gluconolactonase|nr:MAG: hypothetical protein DIU56_03445 [Pseudomonadota bacterium]